MSEYNKLIPKKAIRAIEKFNADLKAFAEQTGEENPYLYEDANTMIQIRDLVFTYDGCLSWTDEDGNDQVEFYITEEEDEETGETYECWDRWCEFFSGIRFWNNCLKRAKRYWAMDCETLDKLQDGEIEDAEEEE